MFHNEHNKAVIRVGDTTDHGGEVITGEDRILIMERPVARIGDLVRCPICLIPTEHRIIVGSENVLTFGRRVAFDGDKTSCGAVLISSLGSNSSGMAQSMATAMSSAVANPPSVMDGQLAADASGRNNSFRDNVTSHNDGFVNAQDLYEEDKKKIIATYLLAIDEMVAKGLRRDGTGRLNAIRNNAFSDEFLGRFSGDQFIRCEPQSIYVLKKLYPLKPDLHLNWGFRMPYTPRIHYWVEAVPLNFEGLLPYNVLVLDPLKGSIEYRVRPSNKPLSPYAHGLNPNDPSASTYE